MRRMRAQACEARFGWPNRDIPVTLSNRMTARHPPSLGLLLTLLALVMQIGFGVPLPHSEVDAVLAAGTLCHSDDSGGAPSSPHAPDCGLCPVCMAVASVAFILPADGPAMQAPRAKVMQATDGRTNAATPPSIPRFAAQPRAPPIQA